MDHKINQPKRHSSEVNHSSSETSKTSSKESDSQTDNSELDEAYPAYPEYPSNEDIYSNFVKEEDMDPEQPSKLKMPVVKSETPKQLDFWQEMSGEELDVPGAELDDEQEAIGSEDEENNFYSLGGEDHHDLEEDNDE